MKNINKRATCAVLVLLIISIAGHSQTKTKTGAIQKCLIVSDIHFDPLSGAKEDTVQKGILETLQVSDWEKYFESSTAATTLDASLLNHDANYAVLKSALINMKRQLPHPAFIVIAGDFIWHNATPADSVLKRKTMQFIAGLFKNSFPNVPIIPAMGNNDTYGEDYDLQDPKFLNDFADAWAPNLPKQSANQLKAQGYYTYKHSNFKLMVINSAPLNFGSPYPAQAAAMLKWVQTNLAAVGNKNVWIISHIPPGLNGYTSKNMWDPAYSQQFTNSVVQYAPKVKLMIASHTHFNDFKVFYNADVKPAPVTFMRIVPSICSNHGNNPSFEIADFKVANGEVINETNYYLNLAALPKGNTDLALLWKGKITTTSLLGGKINAGNFSGVIDNVKNDKTGKALGSYIRFYTVATRIDTAYTVNRGNYMKYLQADSLRGSRQR